MDKYQNKYRIPSARLQGYDYGQNGAYFITICTRNRVHYFGEIVEMRLIASLQGTLAEKYWMEIPNHFPFVKLGNFVVMPNHVHGILIIDHTDSIDNMYPIDNTDSVIKTRVETRLIASLPGGFAGNHNPMNHENISRIIRWYKAGVHLKYTKSTPILPGNPVFMILSFVIFKHMKIFIIILPTTLKIGERINLMHDYFRLVETLHCNVSTTLSNCAIL